MGRASKKSPAAARPYRPDRREWADDGPAGPEDLGAAGTDSGLRPEWRPWPPREGLRRGGPVAFAAPRAAGLLLQDLGQRVLRQLERDRLPGGDDARPGRAVRGRLGRRPDAQGRPHPETGGPLRRPPVPGVAAALGPDDQPDGAAV